MSIKLEDIGNEDKTTIADLVQLIFRLLKVVPKDHKYRAQVLDYIRRKKLTSPLR